MFKELDAKFERAEKETVLASGTLDETDKVLMQLRSEEQYWLGKQGVDSRDAFAVYHALRNARLVAQKLRNRVKEAPEAHDNPEVARDGLQVIPLLEKIVNRSESLKTKAIGANERASLFTLARQLRKEAAKRRLLLSPDEEREELRTEEVKEQSRILADSFGSRIGKP